VDTKLACKILVYLLPATLQSGDAVERLRSTASNSNGVAEMAIVVHVVDGVFTADSPQSRRVFFD
jgi:hypothetical protein